MDISRVKLHQLHGVVIEGVEGHRVSVTIQVKSLVCLDSLLKQIVALLLHLQLLLELQLELQFLNRIMLLLRIISCRLLLDSFALSKSLAEAAYNIAHGFCQVSIFNQFTGD